MYKNYINDFSFFKGIENREFIVQIISKLSPIIGIKVISPNNFFL